MGFYPDDWSGDYPARDKARAHEAVDEPKEIPPKEAYYILPLIDRLAVALEKQMEKSPHPDKCHCSACFALRSYEGAKQGVIKPPSHACLGTPEIDKDQKD
jgi:hypothetical protein